ncbi:hypothetical protein MKW94_008029 [Papaver nudicaule]|uniref:Uncharacterized protein n=1 Tax=Papaver nudicaule TaxID=74823 RepID=A0AA41VS12_PAPNU|nr:hypothetical protein [Papaver nudicaule]
MARSLSNMLLKGMSSLPATNSLRKMVSGSFCRNGMQYFTTVPSDPDTHDDFKPTNKAASSGISLKDIVEKENPVMLYMKGIPEQPRCGFSSLAVRVLNEYKRLLCIHWPTFPQIFIKGEFVGGSDIILNMHQSGELKEKLKDLTPEDDKQEK